MNENQSELLDYIKKLSDDNFIYLTLLGYSLALMQSFKGNIEEHRMNDYDRDSYEWYKNAITNVVYLKKPPPPML